MQEVWEDLKHLGFTSRDLTSRGWSSNIDNTRTYKYHVHYDDNGERFLFENDLFSRGEVPVMAQNGL